ncbi:MAG TPA: RecX family transcriptional regulator [Allosphingosinicella sp.]|nr:RecX family transcriptional regulator [Allosphingosinicella sp.]
MAVTKDRGRRVRRPLDAPGLEQAALSYAGRYATTRARLRAYLARKLRERGWTGSGEPQVEVLVERMAALGYVDDRAFAAARAAALGRRGYGARRVGEALRAAGIEEADAIDARATARDGAWQAALRFAERKRIGPFAAVEGDRPARDKAFAAMLRAGHPADLARRLVAARPGEIPAADTC